MSHLEIFAAALGIANILLVARRSIWNFPVALLMVSVYGYLFWQARLYGIAWLQLFFFVINVYGWWTWRRVHASEGSVPVKSLSRQALLLSVGASIGAALIGGLVMARETDAIAPYSDAAVTALSVVAQLLLNGRRIENWYWWMVVNALSVWLYTSQQLYITAGLYALLLGLAAWGWLSWHRSVRP